MNFIELTVATTVEAEELISDIFWNYSDFGVAVSAVDDVIKLLSGDVIYDYYENSVLEGVRGVSLVKCYLPVEQADKMIKEIRNDFQTLKLNSVFPLGTMEIVKRVVDGDDWVKIWKKHFKPLTIGQVTICPEWIACDNDGTVIKIDSNLAFGTGEHETTSMAIIFMQKYLTAESCLIDIGTGSGILGIAGKMLGADRVVMTDIDEVAVKVATKNLGLNLIKEGCEVVLTDNISCYHNQFDFCVANITAEVHHILAKQIVAAVRHNAIIILSGILFDRAESLIKKFISLDCEIIETCQTGEWVCVVLKKIHHTW